MDVDVGLRWDPVTQGYTGRTSRPRDTQSPGKSPHKSTLCLGGGFNWDPAEAARVAAEERKADAAKAARATSKPKSTAVANTRTSTPEYDRTRQREYHGGWLSERSRTNQREYNKASPEMLRAQPSAIEGPYDPRIMGNRRLVVGMGHPDIPEHNRKESAEAKLPTRTESARRTKKNAAGWDVDASYVDKDPVDARPSTPLPLEHTAKYHRTARIPAYGPLLSE